mgnify:CR=1 FL=1
MVKKDRIVNQTIQDLYRPQFAKAYYNMGMIYDRKSQIERASHFYKRALDKCREDEQNLCQSEQYKKAMTNYAVTLGKQGKTLECFKIFEEL